MALPDLDARLQPGQLGRSNASPANLVSRTAEFRSAHTPAATCHPRAVPPWLSSNDMQTLISSSDQQPQTKTTTITTNISPESARESSPASSSDTSTRSCPRNKSRTAESSGRRFTCELCGMSTRRNSNLKRHLRSHNKKQKKAYQCPIVWPKYCGEKFSTESNFRRHADDQHPLIRGDRGKLTPIRLHPSED